MFESEERAPPTSLRGWLSDVYIPSLLDPEPKSVEALAQRLGGRATVDDPIFGRTSGLPALERYVAEKSEWLKHREARYTKTFFTTGTDRDVSEGVLTLVIDGKKVDLPIAVVAERRRSREVELRTYYTTKPIKDTHAIRSPLVPPDDALVLPSPIAEHVDALMKGDVDALLAGFESDGTMRDAHGVAHKQGPELRELYEKMFGKSGPESMEGRNLPGFSRAWSTPGGVQILKGATADDGRTCALEYTLVGLRGKGVAPQAGLALYERGDSGLLRSLRVYDNLDGG